MKWITFGKVTKNFALLCLFLSLLLLGGCGSSGEDDPRSCPGDPGCSDNPDVNFNGYWIVDEELETREGCRVTNEGEYTVQIKQNGNTATLDLGVQNYIDCTVTNNELQCGGDLSLTNGGYMDYSSYNLRYNGDDLVGEGSWTLESTENPSCSGTTGTSTFSATLDSAPPPDTPNFHGNWEIYEEQRIDNYHYRQYSYQVRVEQTGNQATLYRGNEQMTCDILDQDLVCQGSFLYEDLYQDDDFSCTFDSYRLRHDSNNGLTGEASWSVTYQGRNHLGESNLTTTRPERGSVVFWNRTNYTFLYLSVRPCGSSSWGSNELDSDQDLEPDETMTFYNTVPGCYDIQACEERWGGGECGIEEDFTINGGETRRLDINYNSSLRLKQNSSNSEQSTGSIVRAFKSSSR